MATRLAFYVSSLDNREFEKIKDSLFGLGQIDRCPRCFFVKEKNNNFCVFCLDSKRDKTTIAIVEEEVDLMSLERAGVFNGLYFILGSLNNKGVLTKKQELRIKHLKKFIDKYLGGKAKEIIIAVDSNTAGDIISHAIESAISGSAEKISRLGRGLPTGGEVEFADEETLAQAIEGRRQKQ